MKTEDLSSPDLPGRGERVMGLEPTTATLATWRSTTELHPRSIREETENYRFFLSLLQIIKVRWAISREDAVCRANRRQQSSLALSFLLLPDPNWTSLCRLWQKIWSSAKNRSQETNRVLRLQRERYASRNRPNFRSRPSLARDSSRS